MQRVFIESYVFKKKSKIPQVCVSVELWRQNIFEMLQKANL